MEINAVLHKVREGNLDSLVRKLKTAMALGPDIIIGPDYSLNPNPEKVSSSKQKETIYNLICSISENSDSLILPGTILYPINEHEVVCEAPVFLRGKILKSFFKERDNWERKLAEKDGYSYRKGDSSKNKFDYLGKRIAVKICGDHGNQDVRGCNLEIILTYDSKAGFWLSVANDTFARKVIICDGYSPKAEAFDYDPNRNNKLTQIIGKKDKSRRTVSFVV